MKKVSLSLTVLFILITTFATRAQTGSSAPTYENLSKAKTEVYYFHYSRRCATCLAVEDETRQILNDLYPEQMKSGEIIFLSLNLEEETNVPLAERVGADGQTLVVVKGDKTRNLTNTAFMYVRTKPEKLKEAIKQAVEEL
ncbi:MAG: hypothetical protein Kow00127_13870 [Bacteroidales bacterium]